MSDRPVDTPAEPRPAASVMLVRAPAPGAPEPIEVYMMWTDFDWKEARWTTPPPGV